MKLRDYQEECIEILQKDIKKQLIQLPTGSGKTFIFLNYLRKNSSKCLIVVPTLDLQEQVYESALNFYHKDEIYKRKDIHIFKEAKIYILVANSLTNKRVREYFKNINLDHIIFDEAHKALCNTYLNFLEFINVYNSEYKLIGFTATPERLDRKSLLHLFDKITYQKTLYDLIVSGFLCDLECFRITTKCDLKTLGKTKDFQPNELKLLDSYSRNSLIYKTYFENCINKKTLIFCLSVDHAEKLADYLRTEKGIKAYHISGRQTIHHRNEILQKFKKGEIKVLTNCQLLTEGFDEPSIEAIIMARPTKSKSLYCQMIGRGTRLYPGKSICSIYELTDNTHKICTFNVAADEEKDDNFTKEYRQGIRLTELHKEISEISLSNYFLEKEKIDIIDDFSSFLQSKGMLDSQKKNLLNNKIEFIEPVNFLQASFMGFLNNLKVKYGFNY